MPVAITMTDTSSQPVYVCVSSDIYQDVPKLTRNSRVVPFSRLQTTALRDVVQKQTCRHENLPEPMLLKPNEPADVDWLILEDDRTVPTAAHFWYDTLPAGHYELTVQRRLGCCNGAMIQSTPISFDVVP